MVKKILIVDDDEIFANAIKGELNREDEQVIYAQDGEEGFAKARAELPDVILLDVIMPKMLGVSVLERLKEENSTKFIPIIIASNFGGDNNEKRVLELGASEFILKTGSTPKQIADTLRKYMPTSIVVASSTTPQ